MQDKIYIHYGHAAFDPSLFVKIRNNSPWNKPIGGLWASPVNATFGWKDWCEAEEFRECIENNSFKFTLPGANVLTINSVEDLRKAPTLDYNGIGWIIDFERCIKLGYDAIELNISKSHELYWELYGWDCDSILVMNPDKIKMDSRKLQGIL